MGEPGYKSRTMRAMATGLSCLVLSSGCTSEVGTVVIQLKPDDPYHFDQLQALIADPAEGPRGPLEDLINHYEYVWYQNGDEVVGLTLSTVAADRLHDGDEWAVAVTPIWEEERGPTSEAQVTVNTRPTVEIALSDSEDSSEPLIVTILSLEDPNPGDPDPEISIAWTVQYEDDGLPVIETWEAPTPNGDTVPAAMIDDGDKWTVTVTPFTQVGPGHAEEIAYGTAKSSYVIFYDYTAQQGDTGDSDTGWEPDSGWSGGTGWWPDSGWSGGTGWWPDSGWSGGTGWWPDSGWSGDTGWWPDSGWDSDSDTDTDWGSDTGWWPDTGWSDTDTDWGGTGWWGDTGDTG
jgi:hypothetical protein